MNSVKNKRVLREIAKRWCKAIILANEASVSFMYTGLSEDEMAEIQKESDKIANRITNLPAKFKVDDIVDEYFD